MQSISLLSMDDDKVSGQLIAKILPQVNVLCC